MCAALDIQPIITLAYDLNDALDYGDLCVPMLSISMLLCSSF